MREVAEDPVEVLLGVGAGCGGVGQMLVVAAIVDNNLDAGLRWQRVGCRLREWEQEVGPTEVFVVVERVVLVMVVLLIEQEVS